MPLGWHLEDDKLVSTRLYFRFPCETFGSETAKLLCNSNVNFTFPGALLIVPAAGALCSQTEFFGGWPSIFYVSAFAGIFFIIIYAILGTDKPSKQTCITEAELKFITLSNAAENVGLKRTERKVPWSQILRSGPVWAALISVVCHEFPLMTMIMFLPRLV